MQKNKKSFLAEMLLEKGYITKEQIDTAMALQKTTDKRIGQILVELGFITEDKLLLLLSQQLNIPLVDLKNYQTKPDVVRLLPEFYARHFRVILLEDKPSSFLVGMVDPQDLLAQNELERILKKNVEIALIREDDLLLILDNIYRKSEEISHFAESLSAEIKPTNQANLFGETEDLDEDDVPVVNLLRSIFEDAVQVKASDIHIEPDEASLRIRLRVDGVLQEQIIEKQSISQALTQRVKLMSGMNIAEKRLPQDGRFSITVRNQHLDVRVSTIPIQYGESLVMRLLNQSESIINLENIGMPAEIHEQTLRVLTASYGIVLIVGPTGSGKTTTLYAALNHLNKASEKIITVEDPVEYRLPRINQVQVNQKIDLTYASVLRAIPRQDPDTIMIGEMRDHETIEISLRAAMTGHFVLATLHTNDSISSITRLIDMGAKPYLIGAVLRAVIAQRLVRKICSQCTKPAKITNDAKQWLISLGYSGNNNFQEGAGCSHCNNTGYAGRTGIFEFLFMSEELIGCLRINDTNQFIELAKKQPLFHSLLDSALKLADDGITTIEEVIRTSGEI